MYDSNPEEVLLAVVNKVLDFANEGKQAKAQHILPFVYESRGETGRIYLNIKFLSMRIIPNRHLWFSSTLKVRSRCG